MGKAARNVAFEGALALVVIAVVVVLSLVVVVSLLANGPSWEVEPLVPFWPPGDLV